MDEIAQLEKEIETMLLEHGKALFEKYTDSYALLSSQACEEDYVLGYSAIAAPLERKQPRKIQSTMI